MKRYEGEDIEVTYDSARCLHAAECVRGLPDVFDTSSRPWVSPDDAAAFEHLADGDTRPVRLGESFSTDLKLTPGDGCGGRDLRDFRPAVRIFPYPHTQ